MLPVLPSPISSAPPGHRARNEEITGHIIQSCTRRSRLKEKTKAGVTVEAEFSRRMATPSGLDGAGGVTCFQQPLANQGGRKEMRGVLKKLSCS